MTVFPFQLFLFQVTNAHAGDYTCTPYNTHGTSGPSGVMQVIVEDSPISQDPQISTSQVTGAPKFVTVPKDIVYVETGDNMILNCQVIMVNWINFIATNVN